MRVAVCGAGRVAMAAALAVAVAGCTATPIAVEAIDEVNHGAMDELHLPPSTLKKCESRALEIINDLPPVDLSHIRRDNTLSANDKLKAVARALATRVKLQKRLADIAETEVSDCVQPTEEDEEL